MVARYVVCGMRISVVGVGAAEWLRRGCRRPRGGGGWAAARDAGSVVLALGRVPAGSQCRSDRGARWSCVERVWSDVCEMRLSLVLLWLGAAAACGPSRGYTRRQGARRITPLVFGQHDPNISENKNTASGPPEGRITRDDERFKDLVPNYNPDIDFRDDEGTGADRLMTQVSASRFPFNFPIECTSSRK